MGSRSRGLRFHAARPRWTTRPTEAEMTYGGAVFTRASTFVRARSAGRPATDPAAAAAGGRTAPSRTWWVDAGGAVALTRLALGLPQLDVPLSGSPAGAAIRQALAGRTLGVPRNRLCAAVLAVPDSVPERPSGKRNQALRTALTAAAKGGVGVRRVSDRAERRRVAAAAALRVPRLASWARTAPQRADHDWWVAEDGEGALVAIATLAVDAEWASLITLVGIPGSGMESNARYALHHAIVQWLSLAGVGHLAVLDHSPLLLAPGPQHLQRVLGYRPVRLRRPTLVVAAPAATSAPVAPATALPTAAPVVRENRPAARTSRAHV